VGLCGDLLQRGRVGSVGARVLVGSAIDLIGGAS
jgi:hypothetical protein